jgi:uncharacterized integral membrane protein (TIGR00697 family)
LSSAAAEDGPHVEDALPTEQAIYDDLPELSARVLFHRRERVFLIFAGIFLGTLAMLNLIGITHFVDLSFSIGGLEIPMMVAVGVLPYPITFLCTDFISELYGRRRANWVVLVGLALNVWVVFILWLGGILPADGPGEVFFGVRKAAFGAVAASMIAYMVAQLIDVQVFHFWKRLTQGKHLWLRNNGSTLVSQLVDTTAVILITHFYTGALNIDPAESLAGQLLTYIASGYVFKVTMALIDTVPFYLGTRYLCRYLRLPLPGLPHPSGTSAVAAGVG